MYSKLLAIILIVTNLTLYVAPFAYYPLELPEVKAQETDQESKSFMADEDIEIKFDLSKEKNDQGLFSKFLSLVNIKTEQVETELIDSSGNKVEIDPKVFQEGTQEKVVISKDSDLKPGVYTLKIKVKDGEKTYEKEQTFAFGVLALNTNKSIYLPDEEVYLQMASLDKRGHTLCQSTLQLIITIPTGQSVTLTTKDGSIRYSESCGANNVTNDPDYLTYYKPSQTGTYQLELTNLDNGYKIEDSFEVRSSVAFDIERVSATRINPFKASYVMNISVKANRDFKGVIEERVPESFEIFNIREAGKVRKADGLNIISWNVDLKNGDVKKLEYEYQAPKISPEHFTAGTLQIRSELSFLPLALLKLIGQDPGLVFEEERLWQIASDAPDVKLEQQINIINKEQTSASTTYSPTDNSVGLVRFDSSKYSGSLTLKFEAVMKADGSDTVGQATSIYCPAADDCKIVHYNNSTSALMFYDCDDTTCSTGTSTVLDGDDGCVLSGCDTTAATGSQNDIYCISATDCKIVYWGSSPSVHHKFIDCDDGQCSTGTLTTIANTNSQSPSIYCPATDDCKIAFIRGEAGDLQFRDCDDATCSSSTLTMLDGDASCVLTGCSSTNNHGGSNAVSIYCPSATDCKISYHDSTNEDLRFADCDNATCSTGTTTLLDGNTGCVLSGCNTNWPLGQYNSIYCPSATDCKVTYYSGDLHFADCDNATCSTGTTTLLDGGSGCSLSGCSTTTSVGTWSSIYCPSATDCKISYEDFTNSDLKFADCDNATCSTGTTTTLDSTTTVGKYTSLHCVSATDCKISYQQTSNGDLKFADCDNATCSTNTLTTALNAGSTTTVGLYNSSGTQVSCASGSPSSVQVATESTSYAVARTGDGSNTCTFTTTQLATGDYTIRIKRTSGTGYVKAARIVVAQSDPTKITDTQTHIEVGGDFSTTSTTMTTLTNPKYYQFDKSKFSGTVTAYVEATIKATQPSTTSTSATAPGTSSTSNASGGTIDWTGGSTVSNINSSNNVYATADSMGVETISYYLKATNFGFSIPSEGSIVGIEVRVERSASQGNRILDHEAKIIKSDGTLGSTSKALTSAWTTSDRTETYGGSTDLWGETWTPADINDLDFGFALSVKRNTNSGTPTARVDLIDIKIYYLASVTTATAELYNRTDGAVVGNSTITNNTNTWTRVRSDALSTNWDTANADEYEIRMKVSDGTFTASISNAKIIIEQSDAGGISDVELVHSYVNALTTDNDTTYTNSGFPNKFTPANFDGSSFTYYFESTMKTSAGTGYAQAYNTSDSAAVSGSEVTTTSTSYERKRSSALTMPVATKELDTQIKNASTDTTSVSNSWLVIQAVLSSPITVSGTVYQSDESTAMTTQPAMKMAVGSATSYTTTAAANGTFSFTGVTAPASGDIITIWLDTGAGTDKGTLVFKYGTSCTGNPDCTGLSIYQNRVTIDSKNSTSLTNSNLSSCDNDSGAECTDTDIGFTSNSGTLSLTFSTNELHIMSGVTFAPGGDVSAQKLHVKGTYTGGSETLTLSGSGTGTSRPLFIDSGTYTSSTNTTKFTGTSASDIEATTYYNLQLQPSGAGSPTYTLGTTTGQTVTASNNLTVGDGTNAVTVTADTNDPTFDVNGSVTINASGTLTASATGTFTVGGGWTNSGTFNNSNATVTFDSTSTGNTLSGTLTGASGKFHNITFNGAGGGWTFSAAAEVGNNFTLTTGTVTAPSGNLTISGSFSKTGGTFTHNSGTVIFNDNSKTSTITSDADIAFNNFTSTTAGKTLAFDSNTSPSPIIRFAGTFTITGADGNQIHIHSDSAGTYWWAKFDSTQSSVTYAHIHDADCDPAGSASVNLDSTSTLQGTNGYCWVSPAASGTQVNIRGGINLRGGTKLGQ